MNKWIEGTDQKGKFLHQSLKAGQTVQHVEIRLEILLTGVHYKKCLKTFSHVARERGRGKSRRYKWQMYGRGEGKPNFTWNQATMCMWSNTRLWKAHNKKLKFADGRTHFENLKLWRYGQLIFNEYDVQVAEIHVALDIILKLWRKGSMNPCHVRLKESLVVSEPSRVASYSQD